MQLKPSRHRPRLGPTPGPQAEWKTLQEGDLFRLLVENVKDYAILILDPEGRVTTWNAGAARMKGYRPMRLSASIFLASILPTMPRDGKPQRELVSAIERGQVVDEGLAGPQGRHPLLG